MSVLLLNEQELCGHNTFMAKNIGRLHQNLHDFRPPTPCPAFGCISRGIQRTELVPAGPRLSKSSSLRFQTQTSRFLCIFFLSLRLQQLLPVLLCSRSCLDTRGLQLCMLKRSWKRKRRKLSLHPGWRQLGAPEGTKMEAPENYLSAWNIQPFPQNVQQTDLSAIIFFNLQFIFSCFLPFLLSVSITYHQPQSENIT